MSSTLNWQGDQVLADVQRSVASALSELALRTETYAKLELQKGHGVITGTLRRSLHCAAPGYNWVGDHLEPSENTPELGLQRAAAGMINDEIVVQVGSGLRYALPVHQGHGNFGGYHFLTIGLEQAVNEIDEVLEKYKLK